MRVPASLAIPLTLALVAGATTLDGEFAGDDRQALRDNPVVQGKVPASEAFTRDFWGRPLASDGKSEALTFRPLAVLGWRVLWSALGDRPAAFHGLSLLLHLLAVALAWRWLSALGASHFVRGVAAGALAIHGVNAETTASIVSHADLASAALGLAALDLTTRRRTVAWAWVAGAILIVAAGVKESAMLFALMGAVLAALAKDRGAWARTVPFALVAGAIALVQAGVARSPDASSWLNSLGHGAHGLDRVLLGLHLVGRGAGLLAVPLGLAPSHGYASLELDAATLAPLATAGGLLLLLGVVGGALALRARSPWHAAALMLVFGPLVLLSHLVVPIVTDLPERLLYPATLGIGMLLADGLARFRARVPDRAAVTFLACAALAHAALGFAPRRAWTRDDTLWVRAYEVEPRVVRHQMNLSFTLGKYGMFERAGWHWMVALHLIDRFPEPVDWAHIEEVEARGPARAFREGPRELAGDKVCPMLVTYRRNIEEWSPMLAAYSVRELAPLHPECTGGPAVHTQR